MKYLLKQHYYSVCIFIVALAAQGPLRGALRSTQGESEREIIPHHSQAPLPLLGTDFNDFADYAKMYAAHLLAPLKSKKRTVTPSERWDMLQQLRMHMIQYKSEEDLARDRDGNAVPPTLDPRESEFLSTLLKSLTVPPLSSDRIAALPLAINTDILAPLLAGNSTAISPMMHQLFGTHTENTTCHLIISTAISADGLTIVTGFDDTAQIQRYNNTTQRWELQHIINHAHLLQSVAISADGLTIVTGSYDNTAQIHCYNNTAHRWELHHTINSTRFIEFVAISANKSTIVAQSGSSAQIHRYDNTTHRWEPQHIITHKNLIESVAISADGLIIITGSSDNTAQIHRYNNTTHCWELQHTIAHIDNSIKSVAISSDGLTVVIGYQNSIAQVHHYNNGTNRWELQHTITHRRLIESVAISADGSTIVTGSNDGTAQVHRYNKNTHRWELQHTITHKDWVKSVAISSDGSTIVTGSFDKTAQVHRFNTHTNRWELRDIISDAGQFFSVAVSSDGSAFVAGTYQGTTLLYQLGLTKEELQTCIAIVTTHLDVTLLLQDIYLKNKYFPHSTITLTHKQLNTLLKLPRYALEILLKRAKIKFIPCTASTNSSSAATSSGTTESQLLAKSKHPKQN